MIVNLSFTIVNNNILILDILVIDDGMKQFAGVVTDIILCTCSYCNH